MIFRQAGGQVPIQGVQYSSNNHQVADLQTSKLQTDQQLIDQLLIDQGHVIKIDQLLIEY